EQVVQAPVVEEPPLALPPPEQGVPALLVEEPPLALPPSGQVVPTPAVEAPLALLPSERLVRRLAPAVRVVKPSNPALVETPASSVEAPPAVPPEPVVPARQVRVLRPTATALNAGITAGETLPSPPTPSAVKATPPSPTEDSIDPVRQPPADR